MHKIRIRLCPGMLSRYHPLSSNHPLLLLFRADSGPFGPYKVVAGSAAPKKQPPVYVDALVDRRPLTALLDSSAAISSINSSLAFSFAHKGRYQTTDNELPVLFYNGNQMNLRNR